MNASTSPIKIKSIHGTKVDNIYRVLLTRENHDLSWYRIAKLADVAYGWAFRILNGLEEEGIIKGHRIKKPRRLFEKWAARPDLRKYREYHVQNPQQIIKDLKYNYALTGQFAENLINGYLFPRYFDIYIRRKNSLDLHKILVKHGYVGKGNVRLLLTDDHVFFEGRKVDGWPMVSIQQLIVDLIREGAENLEGANLLIERFYHD